MIKQVTEVDSQFIANLESTLQEIKRGMQNLSMIPNTEFLTSQEFMDRTKISRWKFDMLVSSGALQYKKIGRKFYIPLDQVTKYFAGEMILK